MSKQTNSYGMPFLSLLTLLFVGLKLGEVGVVADWCWWAVLSPLWAPWVVVLVLAAIIYGIRSMR